jgi:hypothetical protein
VVNQTGEIQLVKRLGFAVALCVALTGGLLSPAHSAAAKKHDFVIGPSRTSEAHLRGTNGYAASLFISGAEVSLSVSGHHATVQYSARGRVTKRLIKARFGRLGQISLRFHPSQRPHRVPQPPGNCKGAGELVEPGVFVGRIEFVGEGRYTEVHARRAEGEVRKRAKEVCRQEKESGRSRVGILFLHAQAKDGSASFTAFKPKSTTGSLPDESNFISSIIEPHRHLLIFRTIEGSSDGDAFLSTMSHGELVGATIEPPAPFSGSATYLKNPPKPSEGWTGDLAGEFPGIGKVNLTGSDFCAESMLLSKCEGSGSGLVAVARVSPLGRARG